ncbi:MAG: hypothetical protein K5905_01700 [Roseibium sp.]|uniref:hypothetical protein n=1 Tax=Roseibium sp. TaxID=1936156 RepID=UPI002616B26E|nr:hypothetical protein [Roseibium sp.]MCV0424163.1 hypothetical protein [Roseibium sp.]
MPVDVLADLTLDCKVRGEVLSLLSALCDLAGGAFVQSSEPDRGMTTKQLELVVICHHLTDLVDDDEFTAEAGPQVLEILNDFARLKQHFPAVHGAPDWCPGRVRCWGWRCGMTGLSGHLACKGLFAAGKVSFRLFECCFGAHQVDKSFFRVCTSNHFSKLFNVPCVVAPKVCEVAYQKVYSVFAMLAVGCRRAIAGHGEFVSTPPGYNFIGNDFTSRDQESQSFQISVLPDFSSVRLVGHVNTKRRVTAKLRVRVEWTCGLEARCRCLCVAV